MIGLLEGVRVLETGALFCVDNLGSFLAGLGADVIKVETPGRGDYGRDMVGQITPHNSPAHLQLNANKRSVTADLRSDAGRDVFWRLFDTAEVFITGTVADSCDRMGIGYDAQAERNPSIVFCQTTGFGASGPYSKIPTHGYSMNSLAADWPMSMGEDGFLHLDPPGSPLPRKPADATAISGVWAAYCVAAALVRAQRTGKGAYIDISAADSVIAGSAMTDAYILNEHRIVDNSTMPMLNRVTFELTGAKQQHYESKDGKVLMFACIEPQFWERFCLAADRKDLIERHNTDSVVDFQSTDQDLRREIQRVIHTKTSAEWTALAARFGFPLSPSPRTVAEMTEDPHVKERNIFWEGVHPDAGPFTYVGVPAVIPGERYEVVRPAPRLGEHTDSLLADVGFSATEIASLHEQGAV